VSTHTQQSRRLLLDVGTNDVMRLNASFTTEPAVSGRTGQ